MAVWMPGNTFVNGLAWSVATGFGSIVTATGAETEEQPKLLVTVTA
jgi:hypothetical protein